MKTVEQSPIAKQHQALINEISDLDTNLTRLFDKINPALGPNYPVPADPASDIAQPPEETSELAKSLQYEASRLRELNHTVHNIFNRVEL